MPGSILYQEYLFYSYLFLGFYFLALTTFMRIFFFLLLTVGYLSPGFASHPLSVGLSPRFVVLYKLSVSIKCIAVEATVPKPDPWLKSTWTSLKVKFPSVATTRHSMATPRCMRRLWPSIDQYITVLGRHATHAGVNRQALKRVKLFPASCLSSTVHRQNALGLPIGLEDILVSGSQ